MEYGSFRHRARQAGTCAVIALAAGIVASGATATQDATKPPFKVMIMTGFDTAINSNPWMVPSAQAAANVVNRQGGLKVRRIQISSCNTQGNATGQAACARRAVEQRVDAVQALAQFTQGSNPILRAARIPNVGSSQNNAIDYNDPLWINTLAGSTAFNACTPFVLRRLGARKMAIFVVDNATAFYLAGIMRTAARAAGLQVTRTIVIPLTASDYAPFVQAARTSGADGTGGVLPAVGNMNVLRAQVQLGWRVPHVAQNSNSHDGILQQFGSLGNGLHGCNSVPALSDTSNRVVARFNRELNTTRVGIERTQHSAFQAWLSIYALQALARAQRTGEFTKQSLVRTARSIKRRNAINLLGLFKWTPGERGPAVFPNSPNGTVFIHVARNGRWVNASRPYSFDVWARMKIARS